MITCARRTLLGLLSAGLLAAGIGTPGASAYPFALSVTRPLPDDFLGLALEYGTVPAWEPSGRPPNRILPALLRALTPVGRPSIRIGGQSTDRSWWPVRGHPQPRGVTQSLGPRWMRSARALLRATDARLMLGINLEAGSARLARAEADALVAGLGAGNIRALEVGNEPNLYRAIPWYREFDFAYDRATRGWRAIVHPLYDGALMFARAAPPGSRLLRVLSPPQTRLRAWATRGADGRLRLLLINDSPDRGAQVRVRVPRGYRGTIASVERLRAPGAAATTGITIGGRRFGTTRTGTPPPPRPQALGSRGVVRILSVPAASAALVTMPPALDCLERWLALPDPDLGYSCQSVSSIQAIWARSCFPTVSTWWPACSERIRRKFS